MPSDLPHPGELLAGYRIERRLGHGATGVVYLARQVALDRPVALKVVGGPFANDDAFRARFRHEARAAAALDHPNVVTVLDSGEDDERLWLAMRLVDGPDLRVLLRRTGRLEPEHAVSVVEQVADALDAAHAAGLVHRDVKPGNVLVEDAPGGALHAELADFGLVGLGPGHDDPDDGGRPGAPDAVGGGEVEGTPDYAAPEQLAGQEATAAADVYALGRVFAEMLTGDPATPAGPGSTGFAAVVARATDPDPAWRYPTAGALAVAARAVLAPGRASAARVAGDPKRPTGDPATPTLAGSLPSPDEVRADLEYEPVAPLAAPSSGRPSRGRRATTLVAQPRRRSRRWSRALPLAVLVGVAAAAALLFGELRDGMLASDHASDRSRLVPPTGAAGGSASGSVASTGSGSGPATGASSTAPVGTTSGTGTSGSRGDAAASGGAAGDAPVAKSSAPPLGGAGPGTAPSAVALPPARGQQRFGGGSWALDLPRSAGWRPTAVQELAGGRLVLTRLRRDDGTRLVVEHRPGQTAVFGPWPGQPFAVRVPDVGRTDALLFRGGRYAMCRATVCAAVPVNGPSGGVLLIVASGSDAAARRELRGAAAGLRVS